MAFSSVEISLVKHHSQIAILILNPVVNPKTLDVAQDLTGTSREHIENNEIALIVASLITT